MPILAGQQTSGATLTDLISETRRHLESYQRPAMNKLDAAISPTTTDLTFTFDSADIQRGTYLEIDLELFYVWSVEAASKTAVVERAQQGSKAVAHAAGAVVKLNPKFPDFAIAKAINDEMRSLSSPLNGLYSVRAIDLTATSATNGYDLPGVEGFMKIIDVQAQLPGQPRQWMTLTNYSTSQQLSELDFPSGLALVLNDYAHPGRTVRVLYKSAFTPLLLLTDDAEQVAGLPDSMHDLPPMGAAARLAMPREIRRNFFEEQGDSRRAEEVQAGAVTNSVRGLMSLRQTRITEEAARLVQLYPDRQYTPAPAVGLGW